MKLPELKNDYYSFTTAASIKVRQMAFAGIAVIWMFRTSKEGEIHFEKTLFFALTIMVITLALDFLQNLYQVVTWHIYYNVKEKVLKNDDRSIDKDKEFFLPAYLNIITIVLFYAKIVSLIIAYTTLIRYLYLELV
jgi:hypothetical protein